MKAPDRIYLQVCGDCPQTDCEECKFEDLTDNITWCQDRIFDRDVEYYTLEAAEKKLAWLKGKEEAYKNMKIPMWKQVEANYEYPLCLTRVMDEFGDWHYSLSSGRISDECQYISLAELGLLPIKEE